MNRAKFQKSLQSLVGWRERAFILALAERASPNSQLYFESLDENLFAETNYPDGIQDMVTGIWDHLISNPNEDAIISDLDQSVLLMPEDSDDVPYGVYPTRDMLHLLELAMLGGINEEKRRALEASQLSLQTVMNFIEFSEGEGLSENKLIKLFDSHPLIEREFSFQNELSDLLRTANSPSQELIKSLRELAEDEGVSNIGISLD